MLVIISNSNIVYKSCDISLKLGKFLIIYLKRNADSEENFDGHEQKLRIQKSLYDWKDSD